MIEDKKIENLFRDNQHKLDEMPSPMAWERLEVRLEKRELARKPLLWRRLAVAAAVLIAVSMIGLWTFINPLVSANKTAILFPNTELASEIIASDAPAPARPILMSHREKVQYLTEVSNTRMNTRPALAENKLREKTTNISPSKSIRPQAAKPKPQADAPSITTTDMMVQADVEPIVEEKIIQKFAEKDIIVTDNATEKEDDSDKIITDEVAANQAVVVAPTTPTMPTTISTTSGYSINTDVNDAEIAPQYDVEAEAEEIIVLKEQATRETKKKRRARRSADKMTATKDTKNESIPSPAAPAEPELDRFDWLLGKWTDEDDNSFEEWQRIAPNILEGKGYFVVDVDTTYTQSMKIVQSNAQTFFMVNGQLVEGQFELKKYDDSTATFKNKNESNEQITLKKDTQNAYSITIEKSKKQTAREKRKKKRMFRRVDE